MYNRFIVLHSGTNCARVCIELLASPSTAYLGKRSPFDAITAAHRDRNCLHKPQSPCFRWLRRMEPSGAKAEPSPQNTPRCW